VLERMTSTPRSRATVLRFPSAELAELAENRILLRFPVLKNCGRIAEEVAGLGRGQDFFSTSSALIPHEKPRRNAILSIFRYFRRETVVFARPRGPLLSSRMVTRPAACRRVSISLMAAVLWP
jgi:hypothetical protein